MNKFAFNHDEENLPLCMGIEEHRSDEIIKAARVQHIEAANVLELFEATINIVNPKDKVEAMYLGYVVAKVLELNRSQSGGIMQLLSMLGK